jgi:hypothetical protein
MLGRGVIDLFESAVNRERESQMGMRRLVALGAAVAVTAALPSAAGAYTYYSDYNGGCWPAEYEGVTAYDGGSSGTTATVHGYLYKYGNGQWTLEKDAFNGASGVGPRQARVALHDPQDAPQKIVSTHTGTFLPDTRSTSAENDNVCV